MHRLRSGRVPGRPACQRCGGTEATQTLLPDRGTLWTFTTQDFRPPSPPYDGTDTAETFQPYALGYIELPGVVMVEARLTEPDPARLAIGQPMRLAIVPYTVRADGTQVMTFAFAPAETRQGGMMEAVIVGVGLHPFGRFGGKSAMDMAADAVRAALADAGVGWPQVQAGFVGSLEVYNPDAIVGRLGLTGVPLRGVFNGCATAGTAVAMAARAIETGEHDLTIAIGMDKHPRGAFAADPSVAGLPAWYGQTGMFLTTHFFGMKINRYMHDHGITHQTLAQVAAKNFRNASANENAWRRTPLSVAEILASPVLNYPLRQFMYCGPDEGAAAVVLCRADQAHWYAGRPIRVRACALRSRRIGAFEVQSPSVPVGEQAPSPTVDASREAYEIAGIGPQDVAVAQLQDTDAGSEIIHLAENGLCKDGEQERMIADGETEIGGRLPVNTDGGLIGNGEPIGASGLRQIHELVRQLRGHGRGAAGARGARGRLRPPVRRPGRVRGDHPVDLRWDPDA